MNIKPRKLEYGDTIGIISPSDPVNPKLFQKRISRATNALEKIGFKVKFGKSVYGTKSAIHTAKNRALDINNMFKDDSIKAILTTWGGLCSNQTLPYLDFELIKHNPKIIVGYSDTTILLNAIFAKTNLITFHGPALLKEFGEFPTPLEYTLQSFEKTLMKSNIIGTLKPPSHWTDETLYWDKEDYKRPRKLMTNRDWYFIGSGKTTGHLIGGNIDTFVALTGTEFIPKTKGAILLLEDNVLKNQDIRSIVKNLTHIEQTGIFRDINGIILGKFSNCIPQTQRIIESILVNLVNKYNYPIVTEVDFGHTDPKLTLPIGINIEINTKKKKISILENAVKS
ncbi:LD-carboxypeptidase [uncultured archaeon]|nr:LD-carboxypeptidase [uncultured archaeon]